MNIRKTNRLQFLILFSLVAVMVSAAALASAQGLGNQQGKGMNKRGGRGMGQEHRMERMTQRLDLTADQQTAIEKIKENSREKGLEIRKEILRLKNEMKGEMLKDNPSEKSVLALNEKLGELKTEVRANRLKTRLKIREQLTPEQQDKMLVMGEKGRKHGRRSGKGFPGTEKGHGRLGSCDGRGPRGGQDCQLEDQLAE